MQVFSAFYTPQDTAHTHHRGCWPLVYFLLVQGTHGHGWQEGSRVARTGKSDTLRFLVGVSLF